MHPLRSRLPGSVVAFSIYVVVALFPCAAAGTDEKPSADFRIYVSNETSGDVSVIDGHSGNSVALILVGKRPRGIQVSPDGLTLYVATSGSPRLGPGADPERAKDEKVDKSADGIAVVDLATQQVTRR
ncbi:MAG TPA: hypothetical protein VL069_07005, partial [Opitutus sp.]|nr:hypothetical protein [Opitutus sp.]